MDESARVLFLLELFFTFFNFFLTFFNFFLIFFTFFLLFFTFFYFFLLFCFIKKALQNSNQTKCATPPHTTSRS